MMTDEELQAIAERCENAINGPWKWVNGTGEDQYMEQLIQVYQTFKNRTTEIGINAVLSPAPSGANSLIQIGEDGMDDRTITATKTFIAQAREDVPTLLAEVMRLRAENARLRSADAEMAASLRNISGGVERKE